VSNDFFLPFINPYFYIKIGIIILVIAYIILSLIILRRVQIMNRVITQSQVSFLIFFTAFVNIILAILLFLLSVVIL
jgi:hypothetical protein